MRMQVILDSSFVRPGSAPIWGGKKGEFRDWTKRPDVIHFFENFEVFKLLYLSKNLPDKHQTWGFCESRCALSDYVDQ